MIVNECELKFPITDWSKGMTPTKFYVKIVQPMYGTKNVSYMGCRISFFLSIWKKKHQRQAVGKHA